MVYRNRLFEQEMNREQAAILAPRRPRQMAPIEETVTESCRSSVVSLAKVHNNNNKQPANIVECFKSAFEDLDLVSIDRVNILFKLSNCY